MLKVSNINPQFFYTPAMIDQNWKMNALEIDTYSHALHAMVLCQNKSYHASALDTCMCDKQMDQYHFSTCVKNDMSLIEASKWKR
jgi:hypothetical protein